MLGTPESERQKVSALNLFHPTASPPFPESPFFHIATQSPRGRNVAKIAITSPAPLADR
jgi:hypothetical protein